MVNLNISLPEQFFAPEERYGYVTTTEMKKVWAVELDLLAEFDRVCRKRGLRYFLDGGTLLGAVRDGRFIPWDDDIDLIMLREDYERLKAIGPEEFHAPYFLQNAYTDTDYRRGMCQLRRDGTAQILRREIAKRLPFHQGICIDIFCLDGLPPEDQWEAFFAEKQAVRKRIGDVAKRPGHSPEEVRELFREYEGICSRCHDTKLVDSVMYKRTPARVWRLRREWYGEPVPMVFEGLTLPAPPCAEGYLREHYGSDFMTPVQISSDHGETIFSAETPWTEILPRLWEDPGAV